MADGRRRDSCGPRMPESASPDRNRERRQYPCFTRGQAEAAHPGGPAPAAATWAAPLR